MISVSPSSTQVQPRREQMDRDIRNSPRTPLWIPRLCKRKFGQFKIENSLYFDTHKGLSYLMSDEDDSKVKENLKVLLGGRDGTAQPMARGDMEQFQVASNLLED